MASRVSCFEPFKWGISKGLICAACCDDVTRGGKDENACEVGGQSPMNKIKKRKNKKVILPFDGNFNFFEDILVLLLF